VTARPAALLGAPLRAWRAASVIDRWRIALVAGGVLLLALGGLVLLDTVSPRRYLGLAAWLVGALVVHDGIIAPSVAGVAVLLRRAGRRAPTAALVIVQGALVVLAVVAIVVVPQILKQGIGTPNPSVLPLDYTTNLVAFSVALVLIAALAVVVALRRRTDRS